jgi:hypothetical protein
VLVSIDECAIEVEEEVERRPTPAADAARGRAALHYIAAQDDTGVH